MPAPSPLIGLIVFVVLGACALLGYRLGLVGRGGGQCALPPAPPAPEIGRDIDELRRALEILSSSTLGVADRVQRLAGELAEMRDSVQEVSAASATGAYTPAIKMAASGCKVDELVENFGLSRGEAELLRKLHGDARARAREQVAASQRSLRH